jgi:beta-lactam-binding protein with PASTA domain
MPGRIPLRILFLLAALAFGLGLAAPAAAQLTTGVAAQQRTMPAVVGMESSRAISGLRQMGMQVEVREGSSSRARGTVISQTPEAGTVIRQGMTAVLGVSTGPRTPTRDTTPTRQPTDDGGVRPPRMSEVPDLTGMPLRLASLRLLAAGLRVGEVDSGSVRGAIAGRVIAQEPRAGTQVSSGRVVNLTLQRRPAPVTPPRDTTPTPPSRPTRVVVPNLDGRTMAQARTALGGARLLLGEVDSVVTRDGAPGTVVRQLPVAGDSVEPGRFVSITIARDALVTVPRVVGRAPSEARRALADAELRAGSLTERERPGAITVLEQSVPAGTRVRPGTVVNLVISRAPVVVPADTPRTQGPAPVPPPPPVVDSAPPVTQPAVPAESVVTQPPIVVAPPAAPVAAPQASPVSPPRPDEPATRTIPWLWIAIAGLVILAGAAYWRSRAARRVARTAAPVAIPPVPVVTLRTTGGEARTESASDTPVGKGRVRVGVVVGEARAPEPAPGDAALGPARVTVRMDEAVAEGQGMRPVRVVTPGAPLAVRVIDSEPVLVRDEGAVILKRR